MATKKESSITLSATADRELTLSRLLKAPRKLLWEVWTGKYGINWMVNCTEAKSRYR